MCFFSCEICQKSQITTLAKFSLICRLLSRCTSTLTRLVSTRSCKLQICASSKSLQLAAVRSNLYVAMPIEEEIVLYFGLQIDANALAGVRRYQFRLIIQNTSVSELPAALFATMNSVRIVELELANNRIQSLGCLKMRSCPISTNTEQFCRSSRCK